MARKQKIDLFPEYIAVSEKSAELGETNDCSIKAVALISGADYAKIKARAGELGRKEKQGTHTHIMLTVLKELGYTTVRRDPQDFIKQYPGIHATLQNITTHHPRRFPGAWKDGKMYLLFSKRHVSAVIDGRLQDWALNRSLRAYQIMEVIKYPVDQAIAA